MAEQQCHVAVVQLALECERAAAAAAVAELERFKTKTYEEVVKMDNVYMFK